MTELGTTSREFCKPRVSEVGIENFVIKAYHVNEHNGQLDCDELPEDY